jgi:hypothetical protein
VVTSEGSFARSLAPWLGSLAPWLGSLAPFLSSAKRLLQIQTSQTNSLSQSRVHLLLLLLGFFFPLLMHLELKELIRIW